MGVGRYCCVALPFILTVASIICLLIAGLTGVASNNLYIFQIDVSNVTIDVSALATAAGIDDQVTDQLNQIQNIHGGNNVHGRAEDGSSLLDSLDSIAKLQGLTAADMGLGKVYDINLWGYCTTWQDDSHNCTKPQFNWAEGQVSANSSVLSNFENIDGMNDTVIPAIIDGLKAFEQLNKWTEVVYIIAMIALALELVIGLFTACSRAVSCVTWLISGIAMLFVVAAATMLTAMATVAVGSVKGAASKSGAEASFNSSYLAIVWLGAAFTIAASLFWLFSVCCCKPENRPYTRKAGPGETEKFLPTGSYQPIGETQPAGYKYGLPARGRERSDLAYEPYSHSRT